MEIEEQRHQSLQVFIVIVALCFLFIAYLYFSKEGVPNIMVYNPYNSTISISFDKNQPFKINSAGYTKIYLKVGEHEMSVLQDEVLLFNESIHVTKTINELGGFINLIKEDLVICSQRYGDDFYNAQNDQDPEQYFRVIPAKELLIAKDWDFEINQSFPEKIQALNDDRYVSKSYKKLFTMSNFLKFAKSKEESY